MPSIFREGGANASKIRRNRKCRIVVLFCNIIPRLRPFEALKSVFPAVNSHRAITLNGIQARKIDLTWQRLGRGKPSPEREPLCVSRYPFERGSVPAVPLDQLSGAVDALGPARRSDALLRARRLTRKAPRAAIQTGRTAHATAARWRHLKRSQSASRPARRRWR